MFRIWYVWGLSLSLYLSPSSHLPLKGRPHGIQMRRRGATPDIRRVREIWWITRRPSLFRLPHRDPSLHWAPLHMLAGTGFLVRRTRGGKNERGICQSGRSPHRFIVYADAKTEEKKQQKDEAQRNLEFPFLGHHPTFGQLKVLTFRIYSFRRLVVKLNGFAWKKPKK